MKHFQSFCLSIGNNACYVLCLIDIAEEFLKKEIDKISAIEKIIDSGAVLFNQNNHNDSDNFFVKDPEKILYLLTGKKWKVRFEESTYKKQNDDYVVEYWSLNGGRSGHFARTYKGFNSLQKSNIVTNGKLVSYRVLTLA